MRTVQGTTIVILEFPSPFNLIHHHLLLGITLHPLKINITFKATLDTMQKCNLITNLLIWLQLIVFRILPRVLLDIMHTSKYIFIF